MPDGRGRPSKYTLEIAEAICERLAAGESLNAICKDEGLPAEPTVRRWALDDVEGFAAKYTRAREQQADALAEEIITIADADPATLLQGGEGDTRIVIDSAAVAHQRLRVDARKWFASKVAPKKYGDKVDVAHSGSVSLESTVAEASRLARGE